MDKASDLNAFRGIMSALIPSLVAWIIFGAAVMAVAWLGGYCG